MAQSQSTRALALARRKALSSAGKGAVSGNSPERTRADTGTVAAAAPAPAPAAAPARPRARYAASATQAGNSSRAVALARRKAMSSQGKRADTSTDRTTTGGPKARKAAAMAAQAPQAKKDGDCSCGCKGRDKAEPAVSAASAPQRSQRAVKARSSQRRTAAQANPTRAAALARRKAQSTRGKAGINNGGVSAAQTARAVNPELTARELARELREMRSRSGKSGTTQKCGDCSGRRRQRPKKEAAQGAAEDQSWKVGLGETSRGQSVTGTMVGRSRAVTGDEASTCRAVTGTEYLGADIFRDFCQAEPSKSFNRVGVSPTSAGNVVTGNEVGRSNRVTGDEPGTCKSVTGTEYLGANQQEAFCATKPVKGPAKITSTETRGGRTVTGNNVGRSDRVTGDEAGADRSLTGTQYMRRGNDTAPEKVGASATLRGGSVTGTMVGRHKVMTGDEAGSCRNVTGDDYVGEEQYSQFCDTTPAPQDRKVGVSATPGGEAVTGTMTGRASRVTGDEPGTCKAITGTPYAGTEQYSAFCETDQATAAAARTQKNKRMFGSVMTGIQPSVGGKMTGDEKGACEPVTGTPYVGGDQATAACPAMPAEPGAPDFPQPLEGAAGGQFSVETPAHAAQTPQKGSGVTGSTYEGGHITGPFGKAGGKVTGTEEARFGRRGNSAMSSPAPAEAPMIEGRVKSRISGEGINAGLKITGDDWDRGDHVTGTEGLSAKVRNPSRRGPTMPMAAAMAHGRPEEVPEPVSKVTGGSGNTDKGALITYSGGARG